MIAILLLKMVEEEATAYNKKIYDRQNSVLNGIAYDEKEDVFLLLENYRILFSWLSCFDYD